MNIQRIVRALLTIAALLISTSLVSLVFVLTPIQQACAGQDQTQQIHACIACCDKTQLQCVQSEKSQEYCSNEYENCVATCNSDGSTPSDWGPSCWR